MENKKGKWYLDIFISKWEKISDKIVSLFYVEAFVKSVENIEFIKILVWSTFIKSLNDFWKWWFKQVFVFLWYLSIIFWLIGLISNIKYLLDFLWYVRWMIPVVLQMIMFVVLIITWFWMIKFKKWYSFVVLVWYVWQIITVFTSPVFSFWYGWVSIFSLLIWLAIFLVWYALIIKNKELFKN